MSINSLCFSHIYTFIARAHCSRNTTALFDILEDYYKKSKRPFQTLVSKNHLES